MPKVHDRVLLALFSLGLAVVFLGGFLNCAPNRLATGVAYPMYQAPALEAAAAMTGLCGLALLSVFRRRKLRSFATILAAALILWGSLAGAAHFAALLMKAGPPAARASLGPAFWTLASVAILAIVDAAQRGNFSFPVRVCIGAAFCAGFFLMAAAGDFDNLSLAREFSNNRGIFVSELLHHLELVCAAIVFALTIGMPLSVLVLRRKAATCFVFASLGILQTIPSIALFGVLIAPMSRLSELLPLLRGLGISGTGPAPAVLALTLYPLLPLSAAFIQGSARDAAAAIGFGWRRLFIEVELPLALPALISGLRVVTIQAIAWQASPP